jgi:hypothetical protein
LFPVHNLDSLLSALRPVLSISEVFTPEANEREWSCLRLAHKDRIDLAELLEGPLQVHLSPLWRKVFYINVVEHLTELGLTPRGELHCSHLLSLLSVKQRSLCTLRVFEANEAVPSR